MNTFIRRFVLELFLVVSIGFIVHLSLLHFAELPLFAHKIILAYIVNIILAGGIFIALFMMRKKFKNQIGFLFLGGSFLKYFVFFIIFYPIYKEDGSIDKIEFASFFIPYAICLVVETLGLMRLLKKVF